MDDARERTAPEAPKVDSLATHEGAAQSLAWPTMPLEQLTIKIQDGTHFSPKSTSGPKRYLTSKNIRFGHMDLADCGWISQREHNAIYRRCDVRPGDVLLTKDGANTGNAAINKLDEEFSLLSSVALIRCHAEVLHNSYLLHYLLSPICQQRLKDMMSGNAITRLTLERIKTFRIPVPRLNDQLGIATVLDAVDAAIERTGAVIAKLKQVRAGLLHDLLTRGLDDNGELRDPIKHPEQFNDSPLGLIPTGWTDSRFEDVLIDIEAGNSPDYPDYPAPPGEWGVLKVSAIWPDGFRPHENKWVTRRADQVPSFAVEDGDLLISRSNTYALVGIVCSVTNAQSRLMLCDKTLRLRLNPRKGLNHYFALLLQTRSVRNQIEANATGTSGSMKNISQGVIRGLMLCYPDTHEQQRNLDALQPIHTTLQAVDQERVKLAAVKSGLMSDLLTGRVPVPETIAAGASP